MGRCVGSISLIAVSLLEIVSLSDEGQYPKTLEFFIINLAIHQLFNILCALEYRQFGFIMYGVLNQIRYEGRFENLL